MDEDTQTLLTQIAAQLTQIETRLAAVVPPDETRDATADQYIITKQLVSIMQGTRDDIVALRLDFRRLAALLEQTLRVRVDDEERGIAWRTGDADRRRSGG